MTLLLKKLEIEDVDCLTPIRLDFNEYPVCVVQCPARKCPTTVRQVVCTAIHLICGYSRITGIERNFQRAHIRLIFLIKKRQGKFLGANPNGVDNDTTPNTEKEQKQNITDYSNISKVLKNFHTVRVDRDFKVNSGTSVEYSIDDGELRICLWSDFCNKFFNNIDTILTLLRELQPFPVAMESEKRWQRGKWMQLLSTELCTEEGIQNEDTEKLLEGFYNITQMKSLAVEEIDIVSKLTTSYLLVLTALNIIKQAEICKILQDVRRIFEYITCHDYTVWFLIPIQDKLINLTNEMSSEILNFQNLKTRIQLANEAENVQTYTWSNMEHVLQDLLIVAFQLAFGLHCKQSIVYLQQLDRISAHQSFQMALSASLGEYQLIRDKANKNYLQQIINVCNSIGIMTIIEYSGGLPIRPVHANIIKCTRTITDQWTLLVDKRTQINATAKDIAKNVEQNLK